jgi:hypothetical protein
MTIQGLLAEASRLKVQIEARGHLLYVEAPAGAVSPAFRATLAARKPDLIPVLWRLEAMRRLAIEEPRACAYARSEAKGGPGYCFSCGDPLCHTRAYGRCDPCAVAADIFYGAQKDDVEVVA